MILSFAGFENPVRVSPGEVSVLEVSNAGLFARICESLLSEEGEYAIEPYSLWSDEGERLKTKDAFLFVSNPFELPWGHRLLSNKMVDRVCSFLLEDDSRLDSFEEIGRKTFSSICDIQFQANANYSFSNEWDLKKLLKCFSFGVDLDSCEKLLDRLILFIDFIADVSPAQPLAFINLKTFLGEQAYKEFCERVFFQNSMVLLLETSFSRNRFMYESIMLVDQDFLEESRSADQSWNPSPCDGENAPTVLER